MRHRTLLYMQTTAIKRLQNILQGNGTKISWETIGNYIHYLQEAYLMFSISNFNDSFSERESIKKHYFYDNGVLNLFLFQPETKLLENLVAIHLYQKYADRLFYYNRNVEVDFCVPTEKLLIQVAYHLYDENTVRRETSALVKTADFIKADRLLIVTYDQERTLSLYGYTILVLPIWEWLLE